MRLVAVVVAVEVVQVFPERMAEAAAVVVDIPVQRQELVRLVKALPEEVRALMQTRTEVLAVAEQVQSAQMEMLAQQLVVMD